MGVQNPNNWHWVQKNCLDWSKEYFNKTLVGLKSTDNDITVSITKLNSLDGDCDVCQRKGRVITIFDMKMVLQFESETAKGTITIPEVAFDTEPDDYQFQLNFMKEDEKTRPILRKKLIPQVKKILVNFGPTLVQVHGAGIQEDSSKVHSKLTKENHDLSFIRPKVVENTVMNKGSEEKKTRTVKDVDVSESESGVPKYNVTSLDFSSNFNTTAEQLYKTLLDPQRVSIWTRGPPDINPVEGGSFRLFGGNIEGKILKLDENKSIQMLWRINDWKEGHFAKITITLKQGDGETRMSFHIDGVPVGDEELVQQNFEDKYIRTIKMTFGFGTVL